MSTKKQGLISSFFSKPKSDSIASTTTVTKLDDSCEPVTKRRKISASPSQEIDHADEDDEIQSRLKPTSGNANPTRSTPSKKTVTDRTSKYLFNSLLPQTNGIDEVQDDDAETARKAELHRRFVRKLGKPDSINEIKRRNRTLFEDDTGTPEEGADDEDDETAQEWKAPARARNTTKKGSNKLTPMEKQIIDIKKANMETLLVVEVGYKFRFFGEDARVAARELGIVCIPGKFRFDEHPSEAHLDRFASASIPVHRLHVHVKRLVTAGHKVGVVRQLETAALKAVGDNRNAPFVRKLTNLYTKGTYVDDTEGLEEDVNSPASQPPSTGFLLCLTEVNTKGPGNDETVHVGLVAVQPATGDIIYDDFEDGFMRSEIESRLLHIAPCEFLIVGDLSKATEKIIIHLSGSKTNVFGEKARIERIPKKKTTAAQAHIHLTNFYAAKLKAPATESKADSMLNKIVNLPEHVAVCLSALINHMSEYGLEHVFDLTKYFQAFSARSHMLLNGNTLNSLEVYQNQTDHTVKGSLLWTLDRTQTKFGSRQLRKWVGRPLLDQASIEARLSAVEELLDTSNASNVDIMRKVLSRVRNDLEKSLLRIYYGKCTRPELLGVLQSFQYLATEFSTASSGISKTFKSDLITSAVRALPSILHDVIHYLDKINLQSAKSNDKYTFFREEHETEDIANHKYGITSVEQDLDAFRTTAAEKLGKKKPVDYNTVAGIDYLIEVENSSSTIKKVPASWTKISGTKKLSRFHPPEVVKLVRERDQHKESLAAACDIAFQELLTDISTKYHLLRDAIVSVATLDCLLSLAMIANQPGYVKPTFVQNTCIDIKGARHPMIEQLSVDAYVPNDIYLSHDARALLVTGPNMGGKSSYVRSVALATIMAQIGSFVPADSATLGIVDGVFTRMGAFDNMMAGESTFMVELSETSDILKQATERSLVVLDELGRGTSTHDGVAIAGSVLDWLVRQKKCLTLFITHYQLLARMADGFSNGELRNVHMRFSEVEGSEDTITFLYEVGEGVAHRSYGLNVARLAGLDGSVISLAKHKSAQLESEMRERRLNSVATGLLNNKTLDVDALVQALEVI